jgi:hypothetical protein
METVYGIEIAPQNDRYVFIAEESLKMVAKSVFPGSTLFNMFPVRKFLRTTIRFSMVPFVYAFSRTRLWTSLSTL